METEKWGGSKGFVDRNRRRLYCSLPVVLRDFVTQAVQHFSVSEPDVVIIDLQLPLALRVIRRLRRLCPNMPIVALTAGSKTKGLASGGSTALIEVSKTSRSETIVDVAQNAALEKKKATVTHPYAPATFATDSMVLRKIGSIATCGVPPFTHLPPVNTSSK
jgi:CheY-like chemotaxis protein